MTSSALPISPVPQQAGFEHVTEWLFDLDNTLYPRECNLFAQIDVLITHYVMDVTRLDFAEARRLQKDSYRDYGTTLNGLMLRHSIDPDHFLKSVHAIDYSPVVPHPSLIEEIRALPGRKFIFTNGDVGHATAVLDRLGGAGLFEVIHDIRAMDYQPKPLPHAYDTLLTTYGIDPTRAAMFDDLDKNLVVPHERGMKTVHIIAAEDYEHPQVEAWELVQATGPHVQHSTSDLAAFLKALH